MNFKRDFNFPYEFQALTGSGDTCHLSPPELKLGIPTPHPLEVVPRNYGPHRSRIEQNI